MITLTNEQLEQYLIQYINLYIDYCIEEQVDAPSGEWEEYNYQYMIKESDYHIADNFLNILGIEAELDESEIFVLFKYNNEIIYRYYFEEENLVKEKKYSTILLKDLINDLEEMNCIEKTIETKGDIIDYKCDDNFNLPYLLKDMLPNLNEKTIFNFMQDGRRGMWCNKVYDNDNNVVLIQLMFNREGDDNIFNFVIDKDYLINNIDYECIANYMDEEEFKNFIDSLENIDYENHNLSKFSSEVVMDWLDFKKEINLNKDKE